MEDKKIEKFALVKSKPDAKALAWAFPDVECGMTPYGGRIIVQLLRVKKKTDGGILLIEEDREAEKWNNMIGKIVEIGPLAFKNRDTMKEWVEGVWAKKGDYVRVPRYGGDRWEVKGEGDDEPVLFMTINDHELIAKVTGNPLSFKAFI